MPGKEIKFLKVSSDESDHTKLKKRLNGEELSVYLATKEES